MNDNLPTLNSPGVAPHFEPGKKRAAFLSLVMIGAVLWPIHQNWRNDPNDNFPLSYYPMFSNRRDAIENFWYVLGRDAQGKRYLIPYKLIGDGGGNQVRRQLRKIMNEGRAPELAQSVAKRLARRDKAPWSEIVTVEVCRGKYVVDDFFRGKKEPVSETIAGSCPVERRTL
jgi:hypothetical protein